VKRKFSRVAKDKKTGVAKKYLAGAKNRAKKAAEIKRTAKAYARGDYIDLKAVDRSRSAHDASKETTKKTLKRKR